MPAQVAHLAAAERGKKAMELLFQSSDDDALPWVVVAAFYSALHYVEAMLDSHPGSPISHCHDHSSRHDVLKKTRSYQNIWKHYHPLYQASMVARYLSFGGQEFSQFNQYLDRTKVETLVIKHWLKQVEGSCKKLGSF